MDPSNFLMSDRRLFYNFKAAIFSKRSIFYANSDKSHAIFHIHKLATTVIQHNFPGSGYYIH